jgi:hypothetical protein
LGLRGLRWPAPASIGQVGRFAIVECEMNAVVNTRPFPQKCHTVHVKVKA